jgi:hypothetical protein
MLDLYEVEVIRCMSAYRFSSMKNKGRVPGGSWGLERNAQLFNQLTWKVVTHEHSQGLAPPTTWPRRRSSTLRHPFNTRTDDLSLGDVRAKRAPSKDT